MFKKSQGTAQQYYVPQSDLVKRLAYNFKISCHFLNYSLLSLLHPLH